MKKINKYQALEPYAFYQGSSFDSNSDEIIYHSDNIQDVEQSMIEKVKKTGEDIYIVKIIKKISPVKKPYDVEVKDLDKEDG